MYRILIAILVFVSVASGCGGSNSGPPTPPPPSPTVGSGNLGNANNGRLLLADGPGITGVGGEFLVQGFTILDEDQNVVSPSLGGTKLMGRLLDPVDDILSVVIPQADGTYELLTTDPITQAKIQLEFMVLEDVDGDGEGNDMIVHTVPVQLVPGYISQVNMTINRGSVHHLDVVFAPEGDADFSDSVTVVIGVERLDGNGEYGEFFALFPDGSLYTDDNNDEFFEPGVDSIWDDNDRNGWPDPEENGYEDAANQSWTYLEGTVTGVDSAAQTFHLYVKFAEVVGLDGVPIHDPNLVGEVVQVRKLSYTVMEGMLLPVGLGTNEPAAPEDIGFTDPFLIDDTLDGRTVIVQGILDGNIVDANVIFELSQEPTLPGGVF